jgi:hypothetical protein
MERGAMRRSIILISLVVLTGCAGGAMHPRVGPGATAGPDGPGSGQAKTAGELQLQLSAAAEGGAYRLMLSAPNAADIYQIAGTLAYDTSRYTLIATEAGGGLGGPEAAYFLAGETAQGRIAFAYTKRAYGPGASGGVNLLSVRVTPNAGFSLGDFSLDTSAGRLLVRNSKKQAFAVSVEAAP